MLTLQDLLGQEKGNEAVEQLSRNLGANQTSVNSAIQMALPVILGGLARNASDPQGAQSLNSAIEQDHDGSLLDNLMGYLGGGVSQPQASRQTNGIGILDHIFGNKQTEIAKEVSQNTDLDMGQVAQLLITLAPIVMSYLGKQKQEQNLDSGGLSNWLGGQRQQIEQSPQGGFLNSILDRDGDGSSMDDLASMAVNYMKNRG
ncbi:MAG TPA: DUF937 domain-containing protein [Pyrinomonadaceae bacterium]|nr:DUF937 domain-containing protein [Pyrinomonadaceae bacterium]